VKFKIRVFVKILMLKKLRQQIVLIYNNGC